MNPRLWLQEQLNSRREKNPRYSLRSFARHLGVSPGRLSELLNGQRNMSSVLAEKFAARLELPDEERSALVSAARKLRKRTPSARVRSDLTPSKPRYHTVPKDMFEFISDWQHFGILALMETDDFIGDERWMARRLGLSVEAVIQAMERLELCNLIQESESGWTLTGHNLASTTETPSKGLRKHHRQQMQIAASSLDTVPLHQREFTSVTMAIDPDRLVVAKKSIKDFRRQLCAYLEGGRRREVYSLNIQLIPLTKLPTDEERTDLGSGLTRGIHPLGFRAKSSFK